MERIKLGYGILSWPRGERVSDRYGLVMLVDGDSDDKQLINNAKLELPAIKSNEGKEGKLIVVVKAIRQSTHIGDMFRGFRPKTPKVGAEIELGQGVLFTERVDVKYKCIGLEPTDGRQSDWLDPKKLYNCHEQTVELYFQPK